jgi:3'(2'),5'-bisphosphate nucleotidase
MGRLHGAARSIHAQAGSGGIGLEVTRVLLETLCGIATEAGKSILSVCEKTVAVTRKGDDSPLTEADLRADQIIRMRLEDAFPGVFILSEESRSGGEPLPGQPFFIVDPLDGTREFLSGNGEYTVNIALVSEGLVAGVVHAPSRHLLYAAARGVGAFKQDDAGALQPIHAHTVAEEAPLRVIGSRSHASPLFEQCLRGLGRTHQVVPMGSSLKFCLVAEGAADFYPRHSPTSQWDTAAGQCILEVAGGQVLEASGNSLRYGTQYPVINPSFVAIGDPGLRDLALRALDEEILREGK